MTEHEESEMLGRLTRDLQESQRYKRKFDFIAERMGDNEEQFRSTTKTLGKFWTEGREESGLRRRELAESMQIDYAMLASFEHGTIALQDLPSNFLVSFADKIGNPEILDTFIRNYGHIYLDFLLSDSSK